MIQCRCSSTLARRRVTSVNKLEINKILLNVVNVSVQSERNHEPALPLVFRYLIL